MNFKKLAPWNWFKKEEEGSEVVIPVQRPSPLPSQSQFYDPARILPREMGQLFDNFFRDNRFGSFGTGKDFFSSMTDGLLKPTLDIGSTDKEYTISVEVPGVELKDVQLEVANNTLTVRGEKKQEHEEKEKNYYRMERTFGAFQRVLSLPEDADKNNIEAIFKNGVLKVTMPRKALPGPAPKRIEIK